MQLTEQNYILFAAKHYTNTMCFEMDEFYSDLQILSHIKKLFTRYKESGVLRERLIINHVISLFNVFEPEAAIKLLFFKVSEDYYSLIKTILVFLNRDIFVVKISDDNIIHLNPIQIDMQLLTALEGITNENAG